MEQGNSIPEMNVTNLTNSPLELTPDLFFAYSAIVTMALLPIYIGSYLSLNRKYKVEEESMSKYDAYMFPIFGSGVLLGLYVLFTYFSKEYINLLLTAYFLFLGYFSLVETMIPLLQKVPKLKSLASGSFRYRLPFKTASTIKYSAAHFVAWIISGTFLIWYFLTKHWIANNILGLSFSVQGVSLLPLGSYQVACILLCGLFFYDIFWVFGTDVMVTVAKSFDAPIKFIFPKSLWASDYSFSMLGLGDVVIPGIFIALLYRYDAYRALKQSKGKINKKVFPTPYFKATFTGYTCGLIITIFVMHQFRAAQPALLYLVPACIGCSLVQALLLGDFWGLLQFEEDDKKDKKNQKVNNSQKK